MAGKRQWVMWGGLSFVATYLLGLVLATDAIPSADESLSALSTFYADSGNRIPLLVGGILLAASAGCALVFATALSAEGPVNRTVEASIARAAAGLFASCVAVGAVALSLVAGDLTFRTMPQPGAETERWLAEFGYAVILVPGMAGLAACLWCLGRSCVTELGSAIARSAYAVAVVSLAALPLSIATGTIVWSQLPFIAWVAWVSASANKAPKATPQLSDSISN